MKILKRIASGGSAALLVASSLATISFGGVAHAVAKTCVWTGATNTSLATATNWSSCGGGAPLAGDTIKFNTLVPSASPVSLTNNLGVALGGVIADQVSDASSAYRGSITINTVTLVDGGTITNGTAVDCDHHPENLVISAVTSSGSITDTSGATSNATFTVTGNYTSDTGTIAAGNGSTIGGSVIITAPVADTPADCGGLGGASASGSSITGFTINGLTVQKGATVNLGNASFPITLGGGSGSANPIVYFYGDVDDNSSYVDTTRTVSSAITLVSNAYFNVGSQMTLNVTGAISGSGLALSRHLSSNYTGVLNMNPSANTSDTEEGALTNPITETALSDSQSSTQAIVYDGDTTTLDGARGYVQVNGGGTLNGTGSAANLYVLEGGTLAPGHSPGKLTATSSLSLYSGSIFQAEIKNKDAGNFDQMVVGSASVTTGNSVSLGDATLEVTPYSGADIKAGDTFTIIDNLSQTPVSGAFVDLPEGATFEVGDGTMKISYVGGDGNDVVLTAMTAITAPDTGFALVTAHPLVTLSVSVLAAGTLLVLARKMAPIRAKARR